jgi:aldose 1-epimerase
MSNASTRRVILSIIFFASALVARALQAQPIQTKAFGETLEGWPVSQFILTNSKGASVRLIDYGAIVTNLFVPDKNGKMDDVVLGFDDVKQYEEISPYMGCIVGRYANRIANGMFTLDGNTYAIPVNLGMNSLHGGFKGLAKRMWEGRDGCDAGRADGAVYDSGSRWAGGISGEREYHGLLHADGRQYFESSVLRDIGQTYADQSDASQLFQSDGHGKGDVMGYVAKIYADHYLAVDQSLIPTGEVAPVSGTPFDFTKAKLIGHDLGTSPEQMTGYDHTMVLGNTKGELVKAADVYDPDSGRLLECSTTEPAVHFFTGNNLNGITGKDGVAYRAHSAFCLETQHYPDSPNHADFPSTILRPGQVYRQVTEFKFSIPAAPMQPEQ